MQVQLRSRIGLLSRVSTLAIIAAASGGLGVVQQAQAACSTTQNIPPDSTTVSSNVTCVNADGATGDVTVNAHVGDPGSGFASFFVGKGGISGELLNNSLIVGGHSDGNGTYGALTIEGDVAGGIRNEGQITSSTGNALQIGFTNGGTITTYGTLTGDITNNAGIAGGLSGNGIAALYGTMSGELINNSNGVITGGNNAVYIADSFTSWSGGIYNNGTMNGDSGGIRIGDSGYHNVDFSGGIFNDSNGQISAVNGTAIYAGGGSYSGGLTNYGVITETGDYGWGVVFDATTVNGDVDNYGTIEGNFGDALLFTDNVNDFNGSINNYNYIDGAEGGVVVLANTFNGNFSNSGYVHGGSTGAYFSNSQIYANGGEGTSQFTNTGSIVGGYNGFVVWADNVQADFTNGGGEGTPLIEGQSGIGVLLNAGSWNGNVTNSSNGTISGGEIGLAVGVDPYDPFFGKALPGTFNGNIQNDGSIDGGNTGALIIADTYTGDFTNNGTITGGWVGAALIGATTWGYTAFDYPEGSFDGNITNTGFMSGGSTALIVSYDSVTGDLTNTETGVLQGATLGLFVNVNDFQGNFTNSGTIIASGGEGYPTAVLIGSGTTEGGPGSVTGGQSFSGDINNSGVMHGDSNGFALILDSYTGAEGGEGFTNSGTITGDYNEGLYVNVNTWNGNFTNQAGGVIEGGYDGALFNAGTITGDFTNYGSIIGHAYDTGWYINTPSFTGNIANGVGGLLSAPSNAFHLRIDTFSGEISNAGIITAPSGDAVVIEGFSGNGYYDGGFTNTGSILAEGTGVVLFQSQLTGGITNDGGTIDASTAISTYFATAATTITNKDDGVILGDVRLSNTYGDTFVGEDGGIIGDIIGSPDTGGEGSVNDDAIVVQNGTQYFVGKISNISSFTVDGGGAALLGALFEGDTAGGGFSSSNVDDVFVNSGGVLYIDKSTTLTAGSYTQQAGGTLEFYLGAPGGAGFSSLTGDQVAGAGDYGQVHITGSATLDGNIAGFLDPAFASANSDLNSVTYNDVLVADGGITGDFSTLALISNNTLFQLDEVLDGNTVDLTVLRSGGLGQLADIGGIVVDTGGPWKSMVNDRSNGIGSGSCSVAGPGWCFNAFAANEAGSTSVMTDATPGTDPFEWLRTGQRRTGETAFWGRLVGVWGDTNGDNSGHTGTNFDTFGGIVGVDHAFSPIFMAGVAAQYTKTNIDFNQLADNADVKSFEIGGYMSYGDARFYVNANTSVIFHNIDVTRFDLLGRAHGDYDGTTYSAYAEAGKIFETREGLRIQPLGALSYAHLNTDSYNETGTGSLLHVFDADLDSLKSMIGARFGYPIMMDSGRKFVPEARIIWAHEFLDDHSAFLANPIGNPAGVSQITGESYNRDSLILGAGFALPVSEGTSLFLDYDANLNEDITTHTVSGGFRSRW
ncbi:MAG: autotransporter domain-containing protein [Alphaproteobacteria bacterium]|nr:autotransporter domain-containing protein [Alphaproteobacteria bacterium]